MSRTVCTHLDQIQAVTPKIHGCEECVKMGDGWVHLRVCLICGHVGCCDDSKNKLLITHLKNPFFDSPQRLSPESKTEELGSKGRRVAQPLLALRIIFSKFSIYYKYLPSYEFGRLLFSGFDRIMESWAHSIDKASKATRTNWTLAVDFWIFDIGRARD